MKSKNNPKTLWLINFSIMFVLLTATLTPQEVKLLLFTLIANF